MGGSLFVTLLALVFFIIILDGLVEPLLTVTVCGVHHKSLKVEIWVISVHVVCLLTASGHHVVCLSSSLLFLGVVAQSVLSLGIVLFPDFQHVFVIHKCSGSFEKGNGLFSVLKSNTFHAFSSCEEEGTTPDRALVDGSSSWGNSEHLLLPLLIDI